MVAFHLGLDCLLKQKQSSEKEIQGSLEIITCDPSIYTIDNPDITVLYIYSVTVSPRGMQGHGLL